VQIRGVTTGDQKACNGTGHHRGERLRRGRKLNGDKRERERERERERRDSARERDRDCLPSPWNHLLCLERDSGICHRKRPRLPPPAGLLNSVEVKSDLYGTRESVISPRSLRCTASNGNPRRGIAAIARWLPLRAADDRIAADPESLTRRRYRGHATEQAGIISRGRAAWKIIGVRVEYLASALLLSGHSSDMMSCTSRLSHAALTGRGG
jgi:hypothetical protein